MASYEGEELGAFLPGLTRIVTQPFKTTVKIAKTFVKSPIKAVGVAIKAPWEMAKAVKFAAMGSKPIFGSKKSTVRPSTRPSASASAKSSGSSSGGWGQTAYKKYKKIAEETYAQGYNAPPSSALDFGIPIVSIPSGQSAPSAGDVTAQAEGFPTGDKKPFPILLLIAGAGVAAFFMFKKKKAGV